MPRRVASRLNSKRGWERADNRTSGEARERGLTLAELKDLEPSSTSWRR